VSENDGVRNAQPRKGLLDQFCLSVGRPDHVSRPVAVAEAGTVENDDLEVPCRKIDQAAGLEILDHAAVAEEPGVA